MLSPTSLFRRASTVATSDTGEYTNMKSSIETPVSCQESLLYDILYDVKPLENTLCASDRMWFLVQQVKQIGEAAFWGNNCLSDCSRRHGWRLNIIAQPKSLGDEVYGFIVFKVDAEQRVLHIHYIAISERHRQKGLGSKLIKALQQYAVNTLTNSTVDRIVCACLPEAVDFYRKHCFRKGKKIVPDEKEKEGDVHSDGRIETMVEVQYAMSWKVPDRKKKGKKARSRYLSTQPNIKLSTFLNTVLRRILAQKKILEQEYLPRVQLGFSRSGSSHAHRLRHSDPFLNSNAHRTLSCDDNYTFVLSWHTISLSLNRETVLSGISGKMSSGSVSALVTPDDVCSLALLETIAAGHASAKYKSAYPLDIRINDRLVDVSQFSYRKRVTYLPSGDAILPSKLTVREALVFHARLSGLSSNSCYKVVSKIISNLQLQLKASTLIQNLSVPERARARVAIALVGRPAALLLESPLEGLDVYEAFQLICVLKQVATDLNTAVLISLAQPSSEVLFALDEVSFLVKGTSVFSGSPAEIVPYFEQLGYLCPPSYSPSDFLLFLFEVVPREEEDRLVSAWHWHVGNTLTPLLTSVVPTVPITPPITGSWEIKRSSRVGFWKQFKLLYVRELNFFFRNLDALVIRVGLLGLLTALMSLVMYKIGPMSRALLESSSYATVSDSVLEDGLSNYYGAVSFMVILAMSGHLEAVTVSIPAIRTLFVAEDSMGGSKYGLLNFFLSQLCIELPTTFAICSVQLVIGYWTIGFVGSFIHWLLVLFLTAVTTSSVGWLIACSTEQPLTAVQLIPLVILPQILFSGLLTDFALIPEGIAWMEYLCFLKYCINVAFLVEVNQYSEGIVLKSIESQKNIEPGKQEVYILASLLISFLCRIGAILALLYYRNRGKISNWITTNVAPRNDDS